MHGIRASAPEKVVTLHLVVEMALVEALLRLLVGRQHVYAQVVLVPCTPELATSKSRGEKKKVLMELC